MGRGRMSECHYCKCDNDDVDDADHDDDHDYGDNDADDADDDGDTWTTGLVPRPRAEPLLCRNSGGRA